jgi:hypothetical protein
MPGKFFQRRYLPNLLVVGSTDIYGTRTSWSETWKTGRVDGMVFAGGEDLYIPKWDSETLEPKDGTSYAAQLKCTSGDCGRLCHGFYCEPRPNGFPPDFEDPIKKVVSTSTSPLPKPSSPPSSTPSSTPRVSYAATLLRTTYREDAMG